jgi:two-component system, OmpR family, alkaline phosphatase synthesis response regulator PhoP
MLRVLVVDDEPAIRQLLQYNLSQAGFEVHTLDSGQSVVQWVRGNKPDLVLLDVMLPGQSGFEICQEMRRQGMSTPVIMLTARDDEIERVLGLEIGADDYVTKPFSPREVVARVRAVLRRSTAEPVVDDTDEVIRVGDIQVNVENYEVDVRGKRIDLTTREFELLVYLCRNVNRVLSRDQLLEHVWGYDFAGDTRIVDVHISHLRDKIERNPKQPEYIKTVRGIGYKLVKGEESRATDS